MIRNNIIVFVFQYYAKNTSRLRVTVLTLKTVPSIHTIKY